MNRALAMPELVGIILDNLRTWYEDVDTANSSHLRRCMRVNKLFFKEASRLAWQEINGLEVLVYLLPLEAYYGQLRERSSGSRMLRNPLFDLSNADVWRRVIEVTTLVSSCKLGGGTYHREPELLWAWCDLTFLELYTRVFPERPLFPRLQHLEASLPEQRGLYSTLLYSCPTLRSINLNTYANVYFVSTKPRPLRDTLQTITSLESLEVDYGCSLAEEFLDDVLQHNQQLATVSLRTTGLHHLVDICSLRLLRHLTLDSTRWDGDIEPPLGLTESSCPLLEDLQVWGDNESVECVLETLQSFQVRPSVVLDVWLDWRRPNVDDLDRLSRLLTSCVKQSLESLTLGTADMENDTGFLLPPSSLEPFFQLVYLKILQLDIQIPIDVSDEDVSLILSALPKLEDLLLSCNIKHVPSNFTPKLSSDCLLKFAKEGTNLRKVGAFIGDWRKVEGVGCSQSQVTEIQVGRSALPSNWTEEMVVEQLLIIFPRLRLLRDYNMVRNDIYNIEYKGNSPWYRVYELLSVRSAHNH